MFHPAVLLWLEIVEIYAALFVAGWWINALVRRFRPGFDRPVTAVLGVALIPVVGWFVSSTADAGLDRLWPWFFSLSVLLGVTTILVGSVGGLRGRLRIERWRVLGADVVAGLASVVITTIQADELLGRGALSVASSNNDVAAYITIADDLSRHGFRYAGTVAGVDLGHVGKTDVYGAYAYLSSAHWIVGRYGFQIALAAIAVAALIVAQVLGRLLGRWTSLPPVAIGLLAVVPQCTFLFTYISTQYFLSQLLGLVLAAGFLELATREEADWHPPWIAGLLVALMSAGLVMIYPHMAFLFPPVVALVVVGVAGRRWKDGAMRVVVLAASVGVGLLVVLPRTKVAIDRLIALNKVVAGWPLPGVLPWGLLGQQDSFTGTVSWLTIVGSVVVLAISAWTSLRLMRRHDQRWPVASCWVAVACLLSYSAFYFLRGGPKYEQWKWISFLQPIFVVAVLAPIVELVFLTVKFGVRPLLRPAFVVVLVVGLMVADLNRAVPYSSSINTGVNWVSLELGTLGRSPALAGVDAVNIELGPYWESMWAAEALAPRRTFVLNTTYYAPSQPDAAWTLARRPEQPVSGSAQEVRDLGPDYVLVGRPTGLTSAQLDGVEGSVTASLTTDAVRAPAVAHMTVQVVNSGTAAWLSSASATGAVNIGVALLDGDGQLIEQNFLRHSLVTFPFVVGSGGAMSVDFDLPALAPGHYQLQVDLVDEGLAWFGDAGASKPALLDLEVTAT